jgi:predicted DCC family thiol-disulfide oxidoreductase YuxK
MALWPFGPLPIWPFAPPLPSPVPPSKDTLYYDGHCGLCRRSARILRALDWLGTLHAVDMLQVPPEELPVDPATALQGIPMRTKDGRTLVGFPAVRRALLRTPLGCLPALVLYLPGISHIAAAVYRYIAHHRSRDAACGLPTD